MFVNFNSLCTVFLQIFVIHIVITFYEFQYINNFNIFILLYYSGIIPAVDIKIIKNNITFFIIYGTFNNNCKLPAFLCPMSLSDTIKNSRNLRIFVSPFLFNETKTRVAFCNIFFSERHRYTASSRS